MCGVCAYWETQCGRTLIVSSILKERMMINVYQSKCGRSAKNLIFCQTTYLQKKTGQIVCNSSDIQTF